MDNRVDKIFCEYDTVSYTHLRAHDTVELIMEFEKAFDIQIPDEDAEKIATVGDAIKYIEEHKK